MSATHVTEAASRHDRGSSNGDADPAMRASEVLAWLRSCPDPLQPERQSADMLLDLNARADVQGSSTAS